MIGKRPQWPYLVAAAVVLAVVVFLFVRLREPDLVPVTPVNSTDVTIAGDLTVEQAGTTTSAHITISGDREVTLRGLIVKVRDEAGAFHDFPELANVDVGTAAREIRVSQGLLARGGYTYYLAYRLDGDWVSLPPWQRITIG